MTARTYCTCRTPLSLRTGSHKMRKQNRALVVIGGGTLSYLPKRWTMRPTGDWLASRAAILDTVRYVRERILSFFTSFTKKTKSINRTSTFCKVACGQQHITARCNETKRKIPDYFFDMHKTKTRCRRSGSTAAPRALRRACCTDNLTTRPEEGSRRALAPR